MGRGYLLRLADMKRVITEALRAIETQTLETFESDQNLYDASLYRILVVAEAANDLPPALLTHYPEVDWHELIGMGNRLKHQYFRVECSIAWHTLTVDFPQLLSVVSRMIEDSKAAPVGLQ